jgi:hypothetical protein
MIKRIQQAGLRLLQTCEGVRGGKGGRRGKGKGERGKRKGERGKEEKEKGERWEGNPGAGENLKKKTTSIIPTCSSSSSSNWRIGVAQSSITTYNTAN